MVPGGGTMGLQTDFFILSFHNSNWKQRQPLCASGDKVGGGGATVL